MKNKIFFIAEISANHCGNFNLAKKNLLNVPMRMALMQSNYKLIPQIQ